jgi:hypothetical protein
MKSPAFDARRQASVATRRMFVTSCFWSLRWQILSACTVRAIEARDRRPLAESPCPS